MYIEPIIPEVDRTINFIKLFAKKNCEEPCSILKLMIASWYMYYNKFKYNFIMLNLNLSGRRFDPCDRV